MISNFARRDCLDTAIAAGTGVASGIKSRWSRGAFSMTWPVVTIRLLVKGRPGARDGKAPPYGDTGTAYMNMRGSLGASNAATASPTGGRMIADNRSIPRHSWSLNLEDLEALRAVGKLGPDGASNFRLHQGHTHW